MSGWAAAGQIASDLLGNWWNNDQANDRAQDQREYETLMSNTSHRREVDDLIKAGLNPILSANKGASTPSGAMAVTHPTPPHMVSSAMEAERVRAETDRIRTETAAIQQGINIKKPVETGAGHVGSGMSSIYDASKQGADAFFQNIPTPSEASTAVGNVIGKAVDAAVTSSAAAGERLAPAIREFADKVKSYVTAPGKLISQGVNSAQDAAQKHFGKPVDAPSYSSKWTKKNPDDKTVNPHSSNRRYFKE